MSKVLRKKKSPENSSETKDSSPYDASLNEFPIDDDVEIQDPISKKHNAPISVSDDEFEFDEDELQTTRVSTAPRPDQLKKNTEHNEIITEKKVEKRKRDDSDVEELPPPKVNKQPVDPVTRTQKGGKIMKQSTLFVARVIADKKAEKAKPLVEMDDELDDEERFETVHDADAEKKREKAEKKAKKKRRSESGNPFVQVAAQEEDEDGESVNNSEDDRDLHTGEDKYESEGLDDSSVHSNGFKPDPLRILERTPTSCSETTPNEREDFHIAYRLRYRYVSRVDHDKNQKAKEKNQKEERLVETLANYEGIYFPDEALGWKALESNLVAIGWKEIPREYPDRTVRDVRVIRMKRLSQWFPL